MLGTNLKKIVEKNLNFLTYSDFASLKSFKGENKFHKWLSNLNNCIERINSK